MKKMFLLIALMILLSSEANGAVSGDMSEYVRKDVFDAKMEAFMAEIRLGNERILNELDKKINEVKTEVRVLEARVGGLETTVYCGLALLGLIVGFAIFAPSLGEFLKSLQKPSLTVEDVQRLIEVNNAKSFGNKEI